MLKKIFLLSLLFILIFHPSLFSQIAFLKNDLRYSVEAEFLGPIRESRLLKTFSIHAKYGWSIGENHQWVAGIGATLTYVKGEILIATHGRLWAEEAHGLGPFLYIKRNFPWPKRFSIEPELATGLIIYSHRFPKYGDIYNFMIRLGLTSTYHFRKSKLFIVSALTLMHVSNSQGGGWHNLGYDNIGGSLGIGKFL